MRLYHAVAAAVKSSSLPSFSVQDLVVRAQSLAGTKQVHALASAAGLLLHQDLSSIAALIISYSTFATHPPPPPFHLSPLKPRAAFLWNSLLRALSRSGLNLQSLSIYNSMIRSSVSPDNRTFPFSLSACSAAISYDFRAGDKGRELHGSLVKLGFFSDVFVGNTLLSFYGACFDSESASKVFDEMPNRDLISWNSMISVFSINESHEESVQGFSELVRSGLGVNSVTLISVLPACGALCDAVLGAGIHGYATKVGLDSNVTVGML
ncbi:Pentatricopeptide repeat-containing protein [Platanthera guangdongensis]|uniref:Pentatricopeptide repeat-containing protein n=1 Tax=Platanthera guangdongensis TaxID=2320717 RepID=A0ABR2M7M3_9ASPA